jgi:hypothetical protein
LKAENLKEILYAFMDPSVIVSEAERLGVVQRERVLDPVLLLISLFLVGGTAEAARLASVLRTYVELGGKAVARSVGNRWFDKELLALVLRTKERGLAYAVGLPRHLPGVLAGRTDWIVFDSTTVKLDDRLIDTWQGTGEYAALKVHVELSLGLEGPVGWHISPAREHDSPHLEINEGRRGTGLIVDLGYVSHRRFEECVAYDVHIVARLKEGWNVRLDEDAFKDQGEMWSGSEDFLRLFNGQPVADRPDEELDIDVLLGPVGKETKLRLVQVATPEGFRALLTNVPRKTHDRQAIAFLYRLRWSVEIHNKLAKTCCQLDEISALKPDNVLTLVHASMIASLIATLICHVEHVERGAVRNRVVRMTKGPLHPMLVWKVISQSSLARHIRDGCSGPEWERYVKGLVRMSEDPNWRAKPSAIDDAKGRNAEGRAWWKSRPKKAKAPGGKAPAKRSTAVKHELGQTNG